MPELPEVEIVKQSLNKKIKGKIIQKVLVKNRNLRFKVPNNFEKKLLEIDPILIILKIITAYNNNNINEPTNPYSSEYRVNIKSVCFSGRNSK